MSRVRVEKIIEEINELFADRSMDIQEAYDQLTEVREAATMNIDALWEDLQSMENE